MPGIHSHQRFCDLASDEIAWPAEAQTTLIPALLTHWQQHALI